MEGPIYFNLNINDGMGILHFKNSDFIPMLADLLNIFELNLLHILKLPKGTILIRRDLEVPLELVSLQSLDNHTFVYSQLYNITLLMIFINRSLGISCVQYKDWIIETAAEEKPYSQHSLSSIVQMLSIFIDTVSDMWGGKGGNFIT